MNGLHPPNVLFVFGDQWRAQATGYAGDPNVKTPAIDRLADESIQFTRATANCPVCSPWRATLMTGQTPLTHGVFVNDVPISSQPKVLAECFRGAGYDTAYIGKWHIDGHGRSAFVPPERRKGFTIWRGRECTHDYHRSFYNADGPEKIWWTGYDAFAQTQEACEIVRCHREGPPLLLMLSWGPPHDPYDTAPESFRRLYDPDKIILRPNVPPELADQARDRIAGYYAHCTALDECVGQIVKTLEETGLAENTLLIFTSDHGDMLGSQGQWHKQRPWDESILVPLLLRYPALFGRGPRLYEDPFSAQDIMPTLLGLAGLTIPDTVEGRDHTDSLRGGQPPDQASLIELPACFHQFAYDQDGRDWRGLRTRRHTYVIDRQGPWILYDAERDPFQMENLVGRSEHSEIQAELERDLRARLEARGDLFLPGQTYIRQAGYRVNDKGDTVYDP